MVTKPHHPALKTQNKKYLISEKVYFKYSKKEIRKTYVVPKAKHRKSSKRCKSNDLFQHFGSRLAACRVSTCQATFTSARVFFSLDYPSVYPWSSLSGEKDCSYYTRYSAKWGYKAIILWSLTNTQSLLSELQVYSKWFLFSIGRNFFSWQLPSPSTPTIKWSFPSCIVLRIFWQQIIF